MARYTGAVCRLCRREGQKLYLKGERCYTDKCGIVKRKYAPGMHGQSRKKMSEYGLQLREKQKARRYYGVLESQFAKYFEMAEKRKVLRVTICWRFWKADWTMSFTVWALQCPALKRDSWLPTAIFR